MKMCSHKRKGTVTNQPDRFEPSQPHAAADCCDRPACRQIMLGWVAAQTGQEATFVPDKNRTN